jgi:hypothetical protein
LVVTPTGGFHGWRAQASKSRTGVADDPPATTPSASTAVAIKEAAIRATMAE